MSTTITYKGATLTTLTNQTKILKTAGKYMEDDLTVNDASQGGSAVVVTEEVDPGGGIIKYITAVDLSNDTVNEAVLMSGYTAHDFQGNAITGTYDGGGVTINNQNKNVSPSTTTFSVTYDSPYTGLGVVTVSAMPTGAAGTPTAAKGTVQNHSITVTPSVTNTAGYITGGTKTGTGVVVSASELVSGTSNVTANGTYDISTYASVYVSVSGGGGGATLQSKSKSYTPTTSTQTETITADNGYDGLSRVDITVTAMTVLTLPTTTSTTSSGTSKTNIDATTTSQYINIPTGYNSSAAYYRINALSQMTLPTSASGTSSGTLKATISRSTSAQYINIPAGYNASAAYYTISATPNGTVTAPATISGSSATLSTGTNTITLSKTISVTPNVTTAGYISNGTAGDASVSLTASVTTKAAATYHPSTTAQTISASQYLTGAQTIAAVTTSNLTASNILSGVTIKVGDSSDDDCVASVTGNVSFATYYTGSSAPSSSLGVNGDIYLQS